MKQMPKSFQKYFWDTDFSKIDLKKNQIYIIERLLEYGDIAAYRWLVKNFSTPIIKKIAAKSRRVSPKTRNFWQRII